MQKSQICLNRTDKLETITMCHGSEFIWYLNKASNKQSNYDNINFT